MLHVTLLPCHVSRVHLSGGAAELRVRAAGAGPGEPPQGRGQDHRPQLPVHGLPHHQIQVGQRDGRVIGHLLSAKLADHKVG